MKVSNKTQQKDSARVEIEEEGIRNLESQKVKMPVRGKFRHQKPRPHTTHDEETERAP